MVRAIALAARLDFAIESSLLDAIRTHRHEIAKSSPARMLEEYYKILRAGSAEAAFRRLADVGLLEPISHELHTGAAEPLWRSLAALDTYRRRFASMPETLTNAVLLGSVLVPLGAMRAQPSGHRPNLDPGAAIDRATTPNRSGVPRLGQLPLARRDVERLRQILGLQRRLRDVGANPRAQRSLATRHVFRDALTWLEIHGHAPELVEHWKAILAHAASSGPPAETTGEAEGEPRPFRRRRRRRRGRRRFNTAQ